MKTKYGTNSSYSYREIKTVVFDFVFKQKKRKKNSDDTSFSNRSKHLRDALICRTHSFPIQIVCFHMHIFRLSKKINVILSPWRWKRFRFFSPSRFTALQSVKNVIAFEPSAKRNAHDLCSTKLNYNWVIVTKQGDCPVFVKISDRIIGS